MNVNKATILGNLTRDPEVRALPSGVKVASFGMATNRFYTDKSGQKQQDVEYHNIALFGRLAEIAEQYATKGSMVYVEGRLRTSSWEVDGVKKYKTEIIGETLQLGPRSSGSTNSAPQEETAFQPQANKSASTINPEDIPF